MFASFSSWDSREWYSNGINLNRLKAFLNNHSNWLHGIALAYHFYSSSGNFGVCLLFGKNAKMQNGIREWGATRYQNDEDDFKISENFRTITIHNWNFICFSLSLSLSLSFALSLCWQLTFRPKQNIHEQCFVAKSQHTSA